MTDYTGNNIATKINPKEWDYLQSLNCPNAIDHSSMQNTKKNDWFAGSSMQSSQVIKTILSIVEKTI